MPTESVKKALPWRAGVPAWIMAVEGLIIAFLGMYIINQPASATRVLLIALGALMLFNGIPRLSRYYSGPAEGKQEGDLLQGWYGAAVGGAAIALTLLAGEDSLAGVVLLFGVALVIGGILELFDRFTKSKGNRRFGLFIMPIVLIVAGVSLTTLRVSQNLTPELIGQILALLGFALLALGLVRVYGNYQKRHELDEAKQQRDQLDKQISAAEQPPAPAPAAPAPAPAAAPPAPAVPPSADDPEDPAVKAALEP
ncbi:MAG: DUF308 domain-containing protein [Anaerolineae bacterium]|nr:DUF308 domain-containing protein [Anaerolineae bacterium]